MDIGNDFTLITQPHLEPHTPTRSPLGNIQMNAVSGRLGSSPPKSSHSGSPKKEDGLQKQYADLLVKVNTLSHDYSQLEEELSKKSGIIRELTVKIANSDKIVRSLEEERHKSADLYDKEFAYYEDSIADLRRKNQRLINELDFVRAHSQTLSDENEEKYSKLLKSCKALQSNLELEQNSKAMLIDQIEHLTKERDFLLHNPSSENNSIIHHEYLGGAVSNDTDSEGSVHGTHLLSCLVDDLDGQQLDTSSPLKDSFNNSLEMANNFQFPPPSISHQYQPLRPAADGYSPPSPDPALKNSKRQSLPVQLKMEDDFVLSPLKLTTHNNTSFFDVDTSLPTSHSTKKRYSSSKPAHSRYNSYDFVPVKVEFQQRDQPALAPDKEYLRKLASVEETAGDRDTAFWKLHGYTDAILKRDSMVTSSSKRSSLLTDFNVLGNDVTKQEIMKLKFELQSLKLHNEKLLSYIGFELQKQKRNIKKLSSKQNLRPIEYSDAKLIEKLKNMLIHKKRVLRSVSINPILSTKYDGSRKNSLFHSGMGIGLLPSGEDDEDFVFQSHFISTCRIDDCDDYGFLNHQSKYNLRVFSAKNKEYLTEEPQRIAKKFKSQTFRPSEDELNSFNWDSLDEDEEGEWGDSDSTNSGTEVDYAKLNTFNQMRYLILGKDTFRKQKKDEALVDENLKYKFLTIVVGIAIIGIRFAHPQQHISHN